MKAYHIWIRAMGELRRALLASNIDLSAANNTSIQLRGMTHLEIVAAGNNGKNSTREEVFITGVAGNSYPQGIFAPVSTQSK